jgi:HK97 gp10 family phage protein
MSEIIKVEGLRATAENLATMTKRIQANISRASLRAAARVLVKAVKAASGTTYNEQDGLIRKGFAAGVGRTQTSGTFQYASVFQRAQPGVVPLTKSGRKARSGKFGVKKAGATAYWWRMLEGGTRTGISPRPWIGPAVQGASAQAVEAFRDRMKERIDREAEGLPNTRGKP